MKKRRAPQLTRKANENWPSKPNQFKPGVSPNPGGRPKGALSLTAAIRRVLNGEDYDEPIDRLAHSIINQAKKGNPIAKEIWNRLDGAVVQTLHTLDLTKLTPEQLAQAEAISAILSESRGD